ncbi:MAG: MBOAT family protein [Eubacteriales bacterium]
MLFSSLEFLYLYLPAVLILYYISPLKLRNIVLFAVSLVFYGWGEPVYVFLMLFSITVSYVSGLFIGKYRDKPRIAKVIVGLTACVTLGVLAFFKYGGFILENLAHVPGLGFLGGYIASIPPLPIGISFYTFQALSYTIDVYRSDGNTLRSYPAFGAFITLFPQLIAGPIIKYKDIEPQLTRRRENAALFSRGIRTFCSGLAKKVLLANTAGAIWDTVKGYGADDMTVSLAWFGLIAFSFQIYFDFSGYSDMAIGLGRMFGFTFHENFDYPYISKSITEFWRRWHISLGSWFREYVYIPMGGNRRGDGRTILNLAVVWMLTGLWHGASWNYAVWGVYFAVILIAEKFLLKGVLEKLPSALRRVYALLLIVLGWLIFTFEDMSQGLRHLGYMFGQGLDATGLSALADAPGLYDILRYVPYFIVFVIASTPYPKTLYLRLYDKYSAVRIATPVVCVVMLVLFTAYLVDSSYNPFLYFRF